MASLRIGLTQRVEEIKSYGERRDCLDQAWTHLLCELEFTPIPLSNCVEDVEHYVDRIGLDGVILTGGNDIEGLPGGNNFAPIRDRFERKLLKHSSTRQLPVFGFCRGMQMLVAYYGGKLTPIENHVAKSHPIHVCDHNIPSYFDDLCRDEVNSFHNFGVTALHLGHKLLSVATAADGSIEAIAHPSLPQAAVMWHPERRPNDHRDAKMIQRFFQGALR